MALELDRPQAARMIAALIAGGPRCAHVAAAARATGDLSRTGVVQALAPLATDLSDTTQRALIVSEVRVSSRRMGGEFVVCRWEELYT